MPPAITDIDCATSYGVAKDHVLVDTILYMTIATHYYAIRITFTLIFNMTLSRSRHKFKISEERQTLSQSIKKANKPDPVTTHVLAL